MAAKSKIKKLFTALWITLAGVPLLLIAAITIVLSSETAQTYVAEKVAAHLSEKSGADITISKVFINLFKLSVDFKDLYVADLNHDTLLYAGSIEARLKSFGISQNYYHIAQAQVRNVVLNMIADSSGNYNYSFLFSDNDSLQVDTSTSDTKFKIEVGKLMLANINYRLISKTPAGNSPIMDFDNLQLSGVTLLGKNFMINEKTEISLQIDSLTAKEHCLTKAYCLRILYFALLIPTLAPTVLIFIAIVLTIFQIFATKLFSEQKSTRGRGYVLTISAVLPNLSMDMALRRISAP